MKIVSSLLGALAAAAIMPLAQAHHSAAVFYSSTRRSRSKGS